jgi:hypothetical protein
MKRFSNVRMVLRTRFVAIASLVMLLFQATNAFSDTLVFDAISKTNHVKFGETNSLFQFTITNTAPQEVTINAVRTSCGCTVAKVPMLPWKIASGGSGEINVAVDVRGKQGMISKVVTIDNSSETKFLSVNVLITEPDPRQRNQMMASADRQAVFRQDCAKCHVQPALGKHGGELFKVACGICHESDHRASMVPDLKTLTKPMDAEYWLAWISRGKAGSLMPAFAKAEGGPLDNDQIQSLVEYLTKNFQSRSTVDVGNPFPVQ